MLTWVQSARDRSSSVSKYKNGFNVNITNDKIVLNASLNKLTFKIRKKKLLYSGQYLIRSDFGGRLDVLNDIYNQM